VPVLLLIIAILYFKNKKKFIIPFTLVVVGAEIVTFFGKILFHRPRPLYAVFQETDFSFPSGHATIAVAFYGYLAYILVKSLRKRSGWPISLIAFLIIVLIGFSRLYLGVHYVSDVLAGYLVGTVFLIAGIVGTEKLAAK
jgi:undecaprenyl-diphosphatase